MKLTIESSKIEDYLQCSNIIDYNHFEVIKLASNFDKEDTNLIEKIYVFIRDNIHHSADIVGKVVTCKASEVLVNKEGICFAKSHLLAAVMRYFGVPTGFCYQKLIRKDNNLSVLHGLNAIFIDETKRWIRLDPRGNKIYVKETFSINNDLLAFKETNDLIVEDIPIVFSKPDYNIIQALTTCKTVKELFNNLPEELANQSNIR